jgi:hypothetical protein
VKVLANSLRRRFVIAIIGAMTLTLAACGEEDDPPPPDNGQAGTEDPTDPPDDPDVQMPDLVGFQEDRAIEVLVAEGISDYVTTELASLNPPGEVLKQLPSPGSSIRGQVTLTIAIPLPAMPDYVGTRFGDARSELEGWGVSVIEEKVLNNERPDGEVIASTPAAGDQIGSEVVLQVAVAPVVGRLGVDVEYVEADTRLGYVDQGPVKIDGELYESSPYARGDFASPGDGASWDYDLGRDWESFEAMVGLLDDSSFEQGGRFRIILDGSTIWEQDVEFGQAEPVSINVSGGLRLRLEVVSLSEGSIGLGWGGARLLGIPGQAPVGGQSSDDG